MAMVDWITKLDDFLRFVDRSLDHGWQSFARLRKEKAEKRICTIPSQGSQLATSPWTNILNRRSMS